MAIIHQQKHAGKRYQIRTAGASIRLYTNGVLHSQFNPNRRSTGSVWDLLVAPALLLPSTQLQRILLLGVAGGVVIHMLNEIAETPEFTGIELDPIHLSLGRRFFGLDLPNVELIAQDARHWVQTCSGPPFDLIVDDMFADCDHVARRAVCCDRSWMQQLLPLLSEHGILVGNFADLSEFRNSAFADTPPGSAQKPHLVSMRLDTLENVVAARSLHPLVPAQIKQRIAVYFGNRMASRVDIRSVKSKRPRVR